MLEPRTPLTSYRRQMTSILSLSALCAVVLTGCSSEPTIVNADAKLALLQVITFPPDLDLAFETSMSECMNEAGFSYTISPSSAGSTLDLPNLLGAGGLWSSIDEARQNGYASSIVTSFAPLPQEVYYSSLGAEESARYDTAAFGDRSRTSRYVSPSGFEVTTPADGCFGHAIVAIYGSGEAYLELISLFNDTRMPIAGRNPVDFPGVREVLDAYGSCMNADGYDVGSLSETEALARTWFEASRRADQPPSPREQELAVTDARCQGEVDFREVLNEAYFSIAAEWINSNQDKLLRLVDLQNDALDRAKIVIEG